MAALKMPQRALGKAATVAKRPPTRWPGASFILRRISSISSSCRILCHFFGKSNGALLSRTVGGRECRLLKTWVQKIKRAGPSHKPHPKATCPHPTRPLRPAGSQARHDYAQVAPKMQPKLIVFSVVWETQVSLPKSNHFS